MSHPSISIVMPLYNKEADVARAINSALRQTITDFELVVVNDGSTDRGPEVVESFDDPRIRLIHQANAGVSAARNRGIREARADLVAFLDADDEWMPTFLEKVLELREEFPQCDVLATNYLYREVSGVYRPPILRGLRPAPWQGVLTDYFRVASRSDPPLCSSAIAVTKEAIVSVGGFPIGVTQGEDLLTWARLAVRFDIAYCLEPLAVFWLRASRQGKPTRSPAPHDRVGDSLAALLPEVPQVKQPSFSAYVALWHRMRASMFLRLRNRRQARRELRTLARYSKRSPQLYLYGLIALCPTFVSDGLIAVLSQTQALKRRIQTRGCV